MHSIKLDYIARSLIWLDCDFVLEATIKWSIHALVYITFFLIKSIDIKYFEAYMFTTLVAWFFKLHHNRSSSVSRFDWVNIII